MTNRVCYTGLVSNRLLYLLCNIPLIKKTNSAAFTPTVSTWLRKVGLIE